MTAQTLQKELESQGIAFLFRINIIDYKPKKITKKNMNYKCQARVVTCVAEIDKFLQSPALNTMHSDLSLHCLGEVREKRAGQLLHWAVV